MMKLYSGSIDPFSHRCRIVLFEKGMDFEVVDVDLANKPEDLAILSPHNSVPVLVERDLVLTDANIINEYIDERFPHPQLMPADPVMRARARLFLSDFEKQLFVHIPALESSDETAKEIAKKHNVSIADETDSTISIEAVGSSTAIEALLTELKPHGIRELVQSGLVAIERGANTLADRTLSTMGTANESESNSSTADYQN